MSGQLLSNLVGFGRVLRGLGLDASPARLVDFTHSLDHVRLGSRNDVYHAARSLFVSGRDQILSFDRAFEAFWRKPAEGVTTLDLRAMGEERRFRRPALAAAREQEPPAGKDDPDAPPPREQPPLLQLRLTQSAREVLRHKDFAELTAEELEAVRRLIRGLRWSMAQRRTRRHRPGDGSAIDLRRTLRRNLRHGGEILSWSTRARVYKPRPLVILADISGSMEPYTRLLLLFLHALSEGAERPVEAFVFGTRLTRISRQLRGRDPDEVLDAVSHAVPDWSGGTRIGAALREFNFRWARRVLGSGAAVLLISDGWDRGEPALLAAEMARLQRGSHRVIWLNPLLGSPDYEPLAQGIRAALPWVDDFLPVHSFASLEDLARRLEALPRDRPLRRQQQRLRWGQERVQA